MIKNMVQRALPPNSPLALNSPNLVNSQANSLITNKSEVSLEQADTLMYSIRDLVPVDSDYRPKYFAALYRMGPARFWQLAERARKGKFPPHLFRRLIDGPKR
jgi:hypothetical protein